MFNLGKQSAIKKKGKKEGEGGGVLKMTLYLLRFEWILVEEKKNENHF